jgi:hypothetical protein
MHEQREQTLATISIAAAILAVGIPLVDHDQTWHLGVTAFLVAFVTAVPLAAGATGWRRTLGRSVVVLAITTVVLAIAALALFLVAVSRSGFQF